ncbi:MAG: sulfotransferase domain-containing protein [Elusimicrobiota bacterium]
MKKKKVVFIIALGHSGSTLLGSFLGAHSKILHIGEIISPISKRGKKIKCFYCNHDKCPVWDEKIGKKNIFDTYNFFRHDVSKNPIKKIKTIYFKLFNKSLYPGMLFIKIFNSITEVDTIIDSSKRLPWAEWNSKNNAYNTRYLFLMRNPKAIIASKLRNKYYKDVKKVAKGIKEKLNRYLRFIDSLSEKDKLIIEYKNLVKKPKSIGKKICSFLNKKFENKMLEYYKYPEHIFGGNISSTLESRKFNNKKIEDLIREYKLSKSYYKDSFYNKSLGFKYDDRWKKELTTQQKNIIEKILTD